MATEGKIINANDYPGIPKKDRETWETARRFYEFISKFKRVPLVGEFGFFIFDQFQRIISFYPKRDLSKPNFQLKQIFSLIKRGWGRDLIAKCKMQNAKLPFISTFFTPAFMAEYFNYPGEIFCIVCDADISRTWAPFNPKASRIKYFAPNDRVVERLKLYGIREDNIFLTGYPLPQDLVGSENLEILKENLRYRLLNLDPQKRFFQHYEPLVEKHLGELSQESNHPLTLMFAVGGAGAQKEIGIKVAKKLAQKTKNKKIKIVLVAGIKEKTKEYFQKNTRGLDVEIIFEKDIENYFQKFNQALRQTDILWTKPSELSFYSALGMPIIIAPAIGSQEEFNKRWLLKSGFGDSQGNPSNTDQWLFDWLEKGYFAEHAMQGFIEGEKLGTLKIKEIIEKCSG
ncbi:MAG: hypothetical protein COX35_01735 [Candidatus Nealsonbacteria bacterium CG23_combo_of_CG06-09_8_20_14_all_37_18]|uniref:Glycosyl transferase family 1 domain-containing protein n=1 Tax=Candidatus Nealsonbacteria bacterium CG23_combo_of_CG06-09_8_20_14_all_37_18 TaxID=1974720 RepID=A0A2G9YYC8_9BACT|nr:MAG: hypothetical protein COX35_01735 [Candidatus Nealsonbacteria bacterium CG23_combo_of_CG06-09_8_20_14_all_37_18]